MPCQFPTNTPLTGYNYGCRCERCGAAKSTVRHRSRRPRLRRSSTLVERIEAKCYVDDNGCRIFAGATNGKGYGVIYVRMPVGRRALSVHRVMYEHYVGPIPDGLEIDHLCFTKRCCEVRHLEPVTAQENGRRARVRQLASPL